jgi:hypothetical protein
LKQTKQKTSEIKFKQFNLSNIKAFFSPGQTVYFFFWKKMLLFNLIQKKQQRQVSGIPHGKSEFIVNVGFSLIGVMKQRFSTFGR